MGKNIIDKKNKKIKKIYKSHAVHVEQMYSDKSLHILEDSVSGVQVGDHIEQVNVNNFV